MNKYQKRVAKKTKNYMMFERELYENKSPSFRQERILARKHLKIYMSGINLYHQFIE